MDTGMVQRCDGKWRRRQHFGAPFLYQHILKMTHMWNCHSTPIRHNADFLHRFAERPSAAADTGAECSS